MRTWTRFEDWVVRDLPAARVRVGRASVRFAAAIAPWGFVFAVVFASRGDTVGAWSLLIGACGVGASPFVLRATRSTTFIGNWTTAFLFQSLVASAWVTEGGRSAAIAWLALCIVAATLVSGIRAGVAWTGLAIAAVWGLWAAGALDLLPPAHGDQVGLASAANTGILIATAAMCVAAVRVTERSYAELEAARLVAEAANRAKSEFLSRMSHELRTPLNAIIGYAELLAEDPADDEALRDLQRIGGAGRHLLSMVNEVLDLAKVESGHLELQLEAVPVRPLVDGVVSQLEPLVAARGNTVEIAIQADLVAWADALRLRQCLLNLVGNATKFTTAGRIRVEASSDGTSVQIDVHDTGIGMTDEQLASVFEPFVQATKDIARAHGGTGLGLAIVRKIVERLGGRVWARSAIGVGSVFSLTVPRAPWPGPAPSP